MILHVKSDAAYSVMPGALSPINGNYYLRDHTTNPTNPSYVKTNRLILTKYKTLWHAFGSTAESKTGGIFIDGYQVVPILTSLLELYHLQNRFLLKIQLHFQKLFYPLHPSQAIQMARNKFYWFCNRDAQEMLNFSGTKLSTKIQIISLSTSHPPMINTRSRDLY